MRKKGSITLAKCWNCKVINQNETVFNDDFTTLQEIANELGLTYSQVVEISSGRKKRPNGRFDTIYELSRIKMAGKLNSGEEISLDENNSSDEEQMEK